MSTVAGTGVDPITLEVIRNALPAISNEMASDLRRTSYNMMIYDVGDYCCALLDTQAALLSQNGGGVSHFVADLGAVIQDGVERYGVAGFQPGDVLLTNHQAVAGQHLNNVVTYTPFFFEGKLIGFPVVRAHWIDVGGLSTGMGSRDAYDPWCEGIQFNQLKIYEAGEPDAKLLGHIRDNLRFPDGAMGDLRSQIAACRMAERRLQRFYERYGAETIAEAIRTIYAETERKCRLAVEQIPDGVYEADSRIDHDDVSFDTPVEVRVKVTVAGSDMVIDLSGCSAQTRGPLNSRTYAAAYVAYKALTTPTEPVNQGSFAAVTAIIPEGNIMMARYPAPMAKWSQVIPCVVDTIFKALAPAIPERIPAGSMSIMGPGNGFSGLDPVRKKRFAVSTAGGSGWGGRPFEDGPSACANVCQGDVRNAPIENVELKAPVIIEERGFRADSAGAGKFRGGFGTTQRVRCLTEGRWNLYKPRRQLCPPWGLWGGQEGDPGDNCFKTPDDAEWQTRELSSTFMPAGTVVINHSGGGGGWGDPLDRDPALVLADVVDELVSATSAVQNYGVVLTADARQVDQAATTARRAAMRSERRSPS